MRFDSCPFNVVFLTDGRPTVGTTNDDTLVASVERARGGKTVRVFSLGVGTDVNTHLLDRLSETTRAASRYVVPGQDLELALSSFFAKISDPVLAGPRLRVRGSVRTAKLAPPDLPDLFRGEELVVLGRYSGSGEATVVLDGTVNGAPRSFSFTVAFPERAARHDFVPRLWATRRVGYLLDRIRLDGESAELREEATELARRYGIVTPWTSYLVLEDEARRDVPVSVRTVQSSAGGVRAREAAGAMYREAREEKSGASAVASAQSVAALKSAVSAGAPVVANELAFGAAGEAPAVPVTDARTLVAGQATRWVNGRTFWQNGKRWVDAQVQAQRGAKSRQVKFGSAEYDALLGRHPEAAPWLALGRNVQLVLGGEVVEVVE